VRQLAWSELAASTSSVAELGEPDSISAVTGFIVRCHFHLLSTRAPLSSDEPLLQRR